jgi:hypothetical protein
MTRLSAARVVATAFGIGAGLFGLEHGFFETQQGNIAPSGLVISAIGPPCEPASAWHACEPALTVIPNFLVTGVVAMVVALVVLIWTLRPRVAAATQPPRERPPMVRPGTRSAVRTHRAARRRSPCRRHARP